MTLTTGSKLAHYEITAKIGEGGMGIVYKAKDSHLDRFVAIKVLPPERVSDPTRKARFVQEAKAASALNHPNIITIYDIDQQDGVDFMVMEYIPGKTLNEMIPRKGMKLGDALKYAVQISDALAKAHSAGIIHRDLKPGNVMVSEDGHVKVLDFGLAKLTEVGPLGEDEATRTLPTTDEGTIVGTVTYMSPEQAEGKRVDARSDIFSFGSVLYEMVTGRKAFQKESKSSTLGAIIHKEPEPFGAEIPQELSRIITRCLQKDITRRFQHMGDVKIALQELKEESESGKLGVTQAAGAIPLSKGIARLTGKKLIYIFGGLLVLAVAYLAFDKYYLKRHSVEPQQVSAVSEVGETQKTIAVLRFENLSSDPEQEYFVDGLSEDILKSLGQIPGLTVIARTSSFSFKGQNKTVSEIASILGVDHILEGSVSKVGSTIRIIIHLVRALDSSYIWSETYNREFEDIFAIREDIAMTVADKLEVTLGIGKSLKQLGGTDNVEAYELFLVAQGQCREDNDSAYLDALEPLGDAVALDPNFALAWALKALAHLNVAATRPADQVSSELDLALNASQRAIDLEPTLAEAYAVLGGCRQHKGDLIGAELAFRKAFELSNEPPISWIYIWLHYCEVGYFQKAKEVIETARLKDPFNQLLRSIYVSSFSFSGEIQKAEEENQRCRALFGDKWDSSIWAISLVRLNTGETVSREEIPYSGLVYDAAKEHLGSPEEGLAALKQIYTHEDDLSNNLVVNISVWAAYYGDPEFAMDAVERASRITATRNLNIWNPVMREVRQLPQFKQFVREIGLVDYWNKFGWPDICHQTDGGDFKCD